ncbi:hypothetical protein TIFTF001_004214 [Ficus carica]|uniref:Uncharacterized protein n=1 Tax=Ficus carica TaxID=3494 RepID=A0AA87ZFB2_FICCA|nr:hypothetical protein TIFTF001_004214 [Ficus carica]
MSWLPSPYLGNSHTTDGVSASCSRAPTPDVAITLASNLCRRLLIVVVNQNRVVDGSPSILDRDFTEWRLDRDFHEKIIGSRFGEALEIFFGCFT